MSSTAQSVSILMVVAAAGLGSVAAFAFQHRDQPGARGFSLSTFGGALWTVVVSINVWPTQFLPAHVSMAFRNGLILVILLGWFLLVIEYVRRERVTFAPVPVAVVVLIPVLTVFLTGTNPLHHLAFEPETPTAVGGGPDIVWGPWHLVFMAYVFTISLASAGLLVSDFQSAHGVHRRQLLALLGGFAVGFIGLNDYLLTGAIETVPAYVRLSPFALLIAAVLWATAVFHHHLFDLVPISRRTVIETMPDPVIAVDDRDVVIDANPAARRLCAVPENVVGIPLAEFCSDHPQICQLVQNSGEDGQITIEDDEVERHFSVTHEPVRDGRAGSIVVLRDVTELKTYEKRLEEQRDNLEVLNQVVRHDVRNDLMVIHGHAERLEGHVDAQGERSVGIIKESAEDAIEFTNATREVTDVLLRTAPVDGRMPLPLTITRQVSAIRKKYPGAVVDLEEPLPDTAVVADDLLGSLFRNLLENAITHNDKDVPRVTISAEQEDGRVLVHVADNGSGVPDGRKERVFGKGEMGLDSSGTGIGLYLVTTLAKNYGGDVWIADNEPDGAVFTVELRRAD